MSYSLQQLSKLSASLFIKPDAGWLDDITDWFGDVFRALWQAVVDFFKDMIVFVVDAVLNGFAYIVSLIPVPDFITSHSIGGLLGGAGPTVGWLCTTMQLPLAMTFIAAGYAFRLLRKLLTLGQW